MVVLASVDGGVILRPTHPSTVLLGDVTADADMVASRDYMIRIRVLDPRKGEVSDQVVALQASFDAGYDLVTEYSLEPVVRILEQLAA